LGEGGQVGPYGYRILLIAVPFLQDEDGHRD